MRSRDVHSQLRVLYTRMIESGLSVKQNWPKERAMPAGGVAIGDLPATAMALRDIEYHLLYREADRTDCYHMKLPDGGLITFQYCFNGDDELEKHRLAYFPSPHLPTIDEAPYLYERDEMFADLMLTRLVRFPIRFDYDPTNHRDVIHPKTHLTLGQFDNCRIPVVAPLLPNTFLKFLLRNFYYRSYVRNLNRFERHLPGSRQTETITIAERRISHVLMV